MAKALTLDPLDWELPSHYARLLFRTKKHLLAIPETSDDEKLFTTHQTIVEKHPISKRSQESLSKNEELFHLWFDKVLKLQSDTPQKGNEPQLKKKWTKGRDSGIIALNYRLIYIFWMRTEVPKDTKCNRERESSSRGFSFAFFSGCSLRKSQVTCVHSLHNVSQEQSGFFQLVSRMASFDSSPAHTIKLLCLLSAQQPNIIT